METLIFLLIVLAFITVAGHLIWLGIAAVLRWLLVDDTRANRLSVVQPHDPTVTQLHDLSVIERLIARFYDAGKLRGESYDDLLSVIREERKRLLTREVSKRAPETSVAAAPVSISQVVNAEEPVRVQPQPVTSRPPRRSFSEVLNSFMEESNIRWGEIIGGLLIIGCSTALVVSLWAQISQIPVLKFLIFTTVTAVLFGIGLYTDHRWKLPTTSRGILTIATLLVPLNFLAIAAVSASNTSGALVIGSELAAPAIFLCLVYFAGRIITPGCGHILSAGVLGSSIGQLLVRHFASVDPSSTLLMFLGGLPVACYVVTVALALRVVLKDGEIDRRETTTVFTSVGTMSFAALLPFGLLLHKSGPLNISMMYLAPLVTLWGLPLLTTGTILWRDVTNRELVASRIAGTALAILGALIVQAGMILAWPNPASSVWIIYGLYALGSFYLAWRLQLVQFTWAGVALLLFSVAHNFAQSGFAFPWQTAFFAHATICAAAAIVSYRLTDKRSVLLPLNYSALISIVLGVACLFQANTWEVTWMQAQRVFWITGILLLLLWLNRRRFILNSFQVALICALVLTVKATLQEYEWYSYLPHAFLHPAALQIQGTALALFCLVWLAFRLLVRRALPASKSTWMADASHLLDGDYALDRYIVWLLLPAFLLLAVYGALSGVTRELAALGSGYAGFNVAGFPHEEALGIGSWVVLGLLLLTMLVSFWERRRSEYLLGALAVFSATVPLLAGYFEDEFATATAWRWLAAAFLIGGSLILWYRQRISERLSTFGWPIFDDVIVTSARRLLFFLTVVPLVVLTMYPVVRAIYYLPVQGPVGGFFSLFDDGFAYGVPLVVVALALIGYALRERMPAFAFYAGVFFNVTVTLAFLLAVVSAHGLMDRVVLVRLVQLNVITVAVYSLPWISARRRWRTGLSQSGQQLGDYLLKSQLVTAVILTGVLFLPGVLSLLLLHYEHGVGTVAIGGSIGWLSLFTIVAAAVWLSLNRVIRLSPHALAALLFGVSCLLAFGATSESGEMGLSILTLCIAVSAWLQFAAAELTSARIKRALFPINLIRLVCNFGSKWQTNSRNLAAVIGAGAVLLSLRTLGNAVANPWRTITPLLAMTALAAAISWRTRARSYIYVAGLLFYICVSLWWLLVIHEDFRFREFLLVNLVANSLAGIVWLWLDLRSRRQEESVAYYFSFHNLAAMFLLGTLGLLVVSSFASGATQLALLNTPRLTWLAFASLATLVTACLFDRYAKHAVAALYTLGLIACAIALQQLELSPRRFAWSATIVLAAYALFTALLWRWRGQLIEFARRFGPPERIGADVKELNWLAAFTILVVATIAALAFWINLTFVDFGLRASAALALIAQFLTFGLLAEGSQARWSRRAAVTVFVAGIVFAGWSWLSPGVNATWLNRSVILMVTTFGITALYGLLLDKANVRFPAWTSSARACVPWLLGGGLLALYFCLVTEIQYQLDFGAVRIHSLSLIAIGMTLIAAVVICVLFALSPHHDPLSLSDRGRMGYVYAAEILLALLFLHIRLTMPWLFTGFIERYWPLVVMLIAYFGVVTSETLRRRQMLVLAQPLQRTGAFLPLLPVLGFWVASCEVDFSTLLFIVGGLYGLLSILRRSFLFGAVAAIAGNAGLWYAFQRTADYQFLQHPQLWLIPVALSVLVAAYLNEDRLTEDQMAGVRYLSLVTIYVSSTADIFINGVANSPWLPLILGSFSLAGVFAGIVFRIRGLLVLGSVFLLLSIVTMIWYASVNFGWTWLWYVAGIVTGATIIFMFAVFEKKRNEVLRVVEGLKEWER